MSAPGVLITETQAPFDDELATEQTVQEMCGHIRDSVDDPEVQRAARDAVSGLGLDQATPSNIARCVWVWLFNHIEFVTDDALLLKFMGRQDERELLISPAVMVRARKKQGDCDCFTMMGCALLTCLGVPAFVKTYKCDRRDSDRWAHVCIAVGLEDGSLMAIDASHGDYPGWEVPQENVYASQLWDMNGDRVGGTGMGRALSGYIPAAGWTGSEMSTTGRRAGPYAGRDFFAVYQRAARSRGLQGIARAKYSGLGDNGDTPTAADLGLPTLAPAGTAPVIATALPTLSTVNLPGAAYIDPTTGNYVDYSIPGMPVGGVPSTITNPSTGSSFNLANFLGSLVAPAAALTSQALAPAGAQLLANGNYLLPNGTVVAGTPTASTVSTSSILLFGGIGLAVVLVLSMMGKK